MIIERDKIYLDGYGRKIRIICTDRKSKYCVVGIVENSEEFNDYPLLYTSDGRQLKLYDGRLDLVKEFREPRYNWTVWLRSSNGKYLYSATYKTESIAREQKDIVSIARIDVDTGEVLQLKV